MDIPKLSMAMSAANTAQSVNIAMMKKALDNVEQVGEEMVKLIQSAGNIDIKI